ncbi:MAG: hypothetical protein PHG65_13600 [Kiritimatiellae bacterium]|nr:hypothetical protein [Kiritimatiellia bacterium]
MIIESLILLAFIAILAALFHFKIKHIAARPKPPEEIARKSASRLSVSPGHSKGQNQDTPGSTPAPPQEPRQIDKLNQTNPKAVATMIAQWVDSEPPPEPQRKPLTKRW